jgi:two-component system sensor histidine kinase and response regulator WspE
MSPAPSPMLALFRSETKANAASLGAGLADLQRTGPSPNALEALRRSANAVKGAASIVGVKPAARIAQAMEHWFSCALSGTAPVRNEFLEVLKKCVDSLQRISDGIDPATGALPEAEAAEAERLCRLLDGLMSESPATPAASPEKVPAAGKADPTMLEIFIKEIRAQIDPLRKALQSLETSGPSPALLEVLVRATHSIKGAARIVGVTAVAQTAAAAERCLSAAHKGAFALGPEHAGALRQAADFFSRVAERLDPATGALPEAEAAEAARLAGFFENLTTGAAVSPAGSAKQAPSAAPKNDSAMLGIFRTELQTHTDSITDGLLSLERGGASPSAIEPLMRAAHSIKGASRIVGLKPLVELAHSMEDCFVAAQKGSLALTPEHIDALLEALDLLKNAGERVDMSTGALPGAEAAEAERMALVLQEVRAGKAPSLPVRPAPGKPASPSLPAETQPPPAGAKADSDRIVRVSVKSMNLLMGFSGEGLVQAGRLERVCAVWARWINALGGLDFLLDKAAAALIVGETESARDRISQARELSGRCHKAFQGFLDDFDGSRRRMTETSERLYREVLSSKMRPFSDCAHGFPRMVRDMAKSLGKQARLEILGLGTGVDRDILEKIESPLTHLLRNAIDHGVEPPRERESLGKSPEGAIRLEAWHAAGMLHISIRDDGRGVDMDRLKGAILERKLAPPEMIEKMSEKELLDFLFLPGFSTKEKVTEVSGRGVGLDIVHRMLQEVNGSLHLESVWGRGTAFNLQLPLTLSVIRSLIVEVSGEPYAVPLSRVVRCLRIDIGRIRSDQVSQFFDRNGHKVRIVSARQVLETPEVEALKGKISAVVIGDPPGQYALQVDRFLGQRGVVVRPLDRRLRKVQDVSAAALTDDGSALLILDVDDILRSIELLLSSGRLQNVRTEADGTRRKILVVDDSATVREVERHVLEGKGYDVQLAVNGADGWNAVRSSKYDLIVSDVDMPRMNGLEFVRRVRSHPDLKSIPVIMVSYKESPEDRERGLQAGANVYLTKGSFQDETFLKSVAALLASPPGGTP